MKRPQTETRLSLLNELRRTPDDSDSWNRFVEIYGPKIQSWCQGWGLGRDDAEDVTQNVLLAMARQMKDFEYDANGRFRSWLKTIAYRAWVDFLKARGRQATGTGSDQVHEMLHSVKTREDFLEKMDEECEKGLLEEAMIVVRRRVNEENWLAFQRTAIDGIPGTVVAKELGIAVTAVYKAKSRIQKMLKETVQSLDQFSQLN